MALKEAVEAFDGGEPGLSDPPLDHAALTVDQFQLGQTDIPHMVGALGGAVAGQFEERRQFQGLEWASNTCGVSVMTRLHPTSSYNWRRPWSPRGKG